MRLRRRSSGGAVERDSGTTCPSACRLEEYRSVIPAGPDAGEPGSVSLVDDLLDIDGGVGFGAVALAEGWPPNDVVLKGDSDSYRTGASTWSVRCE